MSNMHELLKRAAMTPSESEATTFVEQVEKITDLSFAESAGVVAAIEQIANKHRNLRPRLATLLEGLFPEFHEAIGKGRKLPLDRDEKRIISVFHLPQLWSLAKVTNEELSSAATKNALMFLFHYPSRQNLQDIPERMLEIRITTTSWHVEFAVKLNLLVASRKLFPNNSQIKNALGSVDEMLRFRVAKACAEAPWIPLELAKLFLAESKNDRSLIKANAIVAAAGNRWLSASVILRAVEMLQDEELRRPALIALGKIGPNAASAITQIQQLRENDPELVEEILAKIGRRT